MSPLESLQLDIAARLETESFLGDIPVFVMRPRLSESAAVIQSKINAALAGQTAKDGKVGAAVTVFMPVADVPEGNAPGPFLEIRCTVRIEEIPALNMGSTGTSKSAEDIAIAVLQALHHFRLGSQTLVADRDAITPLDPLDETDRRVRYNVTLSIKHPLQPVQRVPDVAISVAGETVTLSCGDPAASIHFTTDGSFPSQGSSVYTTPFSASSGATIRAAAYKSGLSGSAVASKTI